MLAHSFLTSALCAHAKLWSTISSQPPSSSPPLPPSLPLVKHTPTGPLRKHYWQLKWFAQRIYGLTYLVSTLCFASTAVRLYLVLSGASSVKIVTRSFKRLWYDGYLHVFFSFADFWTQDTRSTTKSTICKCHNNNRHYDYCSLCTLTTPSF